MLDMARLQRARILNGLDRVQIAEVVAMGVEQHFDQGTIIFQEGEPGRYLYVVLDGVVSIHFGDKFIAKCGEYEAFGEMATLHQRPRSATARATTAVHVLAFGEKEVAQLLSSPHAVQFLLNVIDVLSSRLERGNAWIANSLEVQRK